ncbi:acyltransferase family protein [Cyanobacteria bacterium FACHB-63]|nr:acyltransferase family protein [Cyanobacteria bacterium FACHB-63]
MEFTKEQTNIAKGVAICLMFANHLYAFDDRIINGNSYISIIPSLAVEYQIGQFGNICVSIFLFLSGYGMFSGYLKSGETPLAYSIKKLRSFYFTYWSYFLVFVPIGFLYFQKVTLWHSNQSRYLVDPKIFLENFLGWSATYNGEWWFVRPFVICLIFLFPLYIYLLKKHVFGVLLISLFLYLLSRKIHLDHLSFLGFLYWQISFAIGMICAKTNFFQSHLIRSFDRVGSIGIFISLILCFILRLNINGTKYDFLIAPFFIYFSCRAIGLINSSRLISYLGKYSFPMWLIHSFFCYYYFQDIIYFPKYSVLVFIFLVTTSLLSVLIIEYLYTHILRLTIPMHWNKVK